MSSAHRSHPPEVPGARSYLPLLVAVAIALVFLVFRIDALLRVRGPLIADSSEYLLIVRGLLTDSEVPVDPVRNCFFSALVAGQFLFQGLFLDGPFGAGSGRVLPILFHLLAVFGAYRLGREVHDRRSGALAALLVATLPAFGYWATDCLTDVPAAACFLWAVLWWVRGKPVASGLALAICVLLRYQAIVCVAAFLGIALCSSRRKSLRRVLPGLLLIPVGLGVLDALYWGEPFASFKAHFSVFFGDLGASSGQHGEGVAASGGESSAGVLAMVSGAFAHAIHSDFVVRGPETLTWILTALCAAYAIVRRWVENRRAGDAVFAITVSTFLLLCFFTYDDLRYLTSIVPLVAVVGAAVAVLCIDGIAALIGRARAPAGRRVPVVGLSVLGVIFCGLAWVRQQQLSYRPFEAVLQAVEGLFSLGEPASIGVISPWILPHRYPIDRVGYGTWISEEGASFVDLRYLEQRCEEEFGVQQVEGFSEGVLRDLDYLVLGGWRPRWEEGAFLWRHLNGRVVFDEVFHDPPENSHAAWRFRVLGPSAGDRPFFEVLDEVPGEEPLAEFAGGFSLIDVVGYVPFIRGVMVSGSLAVGNARPGDDLDFLVLTAPKRLWFVFGALGVLQRLLSRRYLCSNYYISVDHLRLRRESFYLAREVVQARPLLGGEACRRFHEENRWAFDHFPNAEVSRPDDDLALERRGLFRWITRCLEWPLSGRLGDAVEMCLKKLLKGRLFAHYGKHGHDVPEDVLQHALEEVELRFHGLDHENTIYQAFHRRETRLEPILNSRP